MPASPRKERLPCSPAAVAVGASSTAHSAAAGAAASPGMAGSSRQASLLLRELSSVCSACKSTTGMCPCQTLALVKPGDTVRGCSPGLFNGNACLLEFSCVAAQGKKWHSPRWKPWDTKQVHTPWFLEVGSCSTGSGFHPPGRKWSYSCWPQSCKVPFRRMK